MDETEMLRKLAEQARRESPPRVNVVAPVMAEIRERSRDRSPLWWLAAGISSALATAAAIVAFQVLSQWQDPLNQWFTSMDTVLR